MITWIRENIALASVLAGLVGVISTGAVAYHQLSGLVEDQPKIQSHMYDSTRHVDPETQKKMEEHIDQLEQRVRELEAARWRAHIDRQRNQNAIRRTR